MPRQPWQKEERRPQRTETCSECGRRFRNTYTAEQALLEAIFGDLMCPQCKHKKDFVTCTACNEPLQVWGDSYRDEYTHYCDSCAKKYGVYKNNVGFNK